MPTVSARSADLVRPDVAAMVGYVPGEQRHGGGLVKLNTNENPYPPSPAVAEAVRRILADGHLNRYPDPLGRDFCRAAGERFGIDPDAVLACNGSDDALTVLTRGVTGADAKVVAPTPSYLLYRTLTQIQGCRFAEVPFDGDGDLPDDFAAEAALALVPNPNSPTGTRMASRRLAELAGAGDGLFVVDEAYAEFADDPVLPLAARTAGLAVTRTMSKAYALAAVRFGYLVAKPELVAQLRKVKDSYNCDALAIAAATAALRDRDYYADVTARLLATRARLSAALADLGFAVTPSHANFVWITADRPLKPLFESLRERDILIRYFDYPASGEGLRITVGTDDQTDRLLDALRQTA